MGEISVRAGGAAGDGIASVGEAFARSLSRMGLYTHGHNAYQSVIRGGHVWFQARASAQRVHSQGDALDVLYALNRETFDIHRAFLSPGATVVFDPEKFPITDAEMPAGTHALPVPTLALARKYTPQSILQNAPGMGATAFLAGIPLPTLQQVLADSFGKKKGDIVDLQKVLVDACIKAGRRAKAWSSRKSRTSSRPTRPIKASASRKGSSTSSARGTGGIGTVTAPTL